MSDGELILPIRVYYEDTDAQGVVYFANYLKFMERGRTEWLRGLGVEQDALMNDFGLCFALIESQVRFHKPARFNEELIVSTRVVEMSRVRVAFEQSVSRDRQLLCEATAVAVCIDSDSFKPRRIPAELLVPPESFGPAV